MWHMHRIWIVGWLHCTKVRWKLQKRWAACDYYAVRVNAVECWQCHCSGLGGWRSVGQRASAWWVIKTWWCRGLDVKYGDKCCHLTEWRRCITPCKPISCDIHLAVASGHRYNILFFLPSSHSPQISQLPLVINRRQQTVRKTLMGSSSSRLSTAAWSIPVNAWQPCNVHLFVFQYVAGMWECDKNGTAVFDELFV